MERQTQHLVRLVDDLLDVSRITQGKIELRKEARRHPPGDRAGAGHRRGRWSRRASITWPLSLPDETVEIVADVTRLMQVIANLLNNAAKYTNHGGAIMVTVERGGDEDVVIRVRDSGIGLRADMLPRVFDLFVQAEHAPDRAAGGLGIGLTLVKRMVQLHGGDTSSRTRTDPTAARSSWSRCPSAIWRARRARRSSPPSRRRRRQRLMDEPEAPSLEILVIEDNPDIRETLKDLLELCGHHVTLAEDGNLGIAAASNGKRHDVALIDIGLPGRDGYEVARELVGIRKRNGHPLRLIAMTGYGQAEDRRRAMEAGFDYHLVKPVEPDALTRLLAATARTAAQGEA